MVYAGAAFLLGAMAILGIILIVVAIIIAIVNTVIRCLLINKAEEGNWWKGIIPIYNRYAFFHLPFNHKTAILFFIVDVILLILSFGTNFTVRILQGFSDAPSYSSLLGNTPTYTSSGAQVLSLAASLVSLLASIVSMAMNLIKRITAIFVCKAFGRGTGFRVAAFFFPTIMEGVLAFGPFEYEEDITEIIPEN